MAETRIFVGESVIHGDFGEVLQNLGNGLGESIHNDLPREQATWLCNQSIVQKLQFDTPIRSVLSNTCILACEKAYNNTATANPTNLQSGISLNNTTQGDILSSAAI